MEITERIVQYMEQHNITQVALARALGIQKSTINYTLNNGKDFSASDIMPIANFLGVSPIWLLTGEEQQPIIKEEVRYVELQLPEDEKTLLEIYHGLDLEGKSTVLATAYQHRNRIQSTAYPKDLNA